MSSNRMSQITDPSLLAETKGEVQSLELTYLDENSQQFSPSSRSSLRDQTHNLQPNQAHYLSLYSQNGNLSAQMFGTSPERSILSRLASNTSTPQQLATPSSKVGESDNSAQSTPLRAGHLLQDSSDSSSNNSPASILAPHSSQAIEAMMARRHGARSHLRHNLLSAFQDAAPVLEHSDQNHEAYEYNIADAPARFFAPARQVPQAVAIEDDEQMKSELVNSSGPSKQ